MKTKNIFGICVALIIATNIFTGCSDEFLKDKQDYSRTTEEVYNDYTGAQGRLDNIYGLVLPQGYVGGDANNIPDYQYPSSGRDDTHSKSTEEYSGLSRFVDVGTIITTANNLPDYFRNENRTSRNPYGFIRNCNDAIEGITNGTLSEEEKKELLGQAYFLRAWIYFRLVRTYGGVPIITEVQNAIAGNDGGVGLSIPRSTTKECIEFICNDLAIAAQYLPLEWNDANWGRVAAGTALALQGRARLLYASPLFNRADDKQRWELAYQSNLNAIDTLTKGNFGLAYIDNPGINASGWAKLFSDYKSPEAVFVKLHNSVKASGSIAPEMNNRWENAIRPKNTGTSGGLTASATIVDLFPMADGSKPNEGNYDPNLFMLNRDPRFYRTFGFPGVRWAFSGDPTASDKPALPYKGPDYELWNYAWYETKEKLDAIDQNGFGSDGLGTDYKGIYVRKRTDDYDVNNKPLYDYDKENGSSPFQWSAAPYMEIRYAEVLLNFAEAACGAGHFDEAIDALQQIRKRVGYTAENNYGLPTDLNGNRAKLFEAILYERQVELAYEGKRFEDMRRWLLWDGGEDQASLNPSWALTGFGGNTCTYLGVEPLNGKRRDNIELRVADAFNGGLASAAQTSDPLKEYRPDTWNINTTATASAELEDFYRNKLTRKTRRGDELNKVVTFLPKYYLLGLARGAQTNNIKLEQTIGWDDVMTGGMGTFDPIKE